jgi:hypothetical protein
VIPGRAIGRKHDRHRRALVALVGCHAKKDLARAPRLRKHEIGAVGEVFLVIADLGEVSVDCSVEAHIDPMNALSVDDEIGLEHQA